MKIAPAPAIPRDQPTEGDRARARDFLSAVLGREIRGGAFVEELSRMLVNERCAGDPRA